MSAKYQRTLTRQQLSTSQLQVTYSTLLVVWLQYYRVVMLAFWVHYGSNMVASIVVVLQQQLTKL